MNEDVSALEVEKFLNRFAAVQERLSTEIVQDFKLRFGMLSAGILALERLRQESERLLATEFNLFRVLKIDYREVTTHSRFLAELLDPRGSHGQGCLFLKCFLRTCKKVVGEKYDIPEIQGAQEWQIETERVTNDGNLDIVISSRSAAWVGVIENKIWAGDQPQQLARYERWLEKQENTYRTRILFYLTPNGRRSKDADEDHVEYVPISYVVHVAAWLKSACKEIQAEPPRWAVKQYVELIEEFGAEL